MSEFQFEMKLGRSEMNVLLRALAREAVYLDGVPDAADARHDVARVREKAWAVCGAQEDPREVGRLEGRASAGLEQVLADRARIWRQRQERQCLRLREAV